MRVRHSICFTTAACIVAAPAIAADQLKFGKAPGWVVPRPIPATATGDANAPTLILLSDQQIQIEPGKISTFAQTAMKIQTSQGLAAGNVSLPWDPATQTVTVNKFEIRRAAQVIDILASGQTFTTMRRESNLELAMFDGMLTANIQPEGLQEGDIIVLATTTEYSDPILKGHAAASFALWNGAPFQSAYARLEWPSSMKLVTRLTSELSAGKLSERNGRSTLELAAKDVQPTTPPARAPARFRLGRLGEASDFQSWAEVAELMLPLYRSAAVIPATGPLQAEIEKIRAATKDPKERAAKALELVQSRVRYVALLMGQGGYTPAAAETTWSRRFGDCKAKTALLLAALQSLGIEAEPVLVNNAYGDAIADRLPMLGHFNHVLVRARIAGKDYWLDGTRSGDAGIDEIPVPDFGWGLPIAPGAKLVKIVPPPFDRPMAETAIEMDASGGVKAPVPTTVEILFRGDAARAINQAYASITPAQLDEALRQKWKKEYDFVTVASSTYKYDKAKGELRHTIKGDVKMDWRDGWFTVPGSSLAYDPDFERASGPHQQAPFEVSYPHYDHQRTRLRLPPGLAAAQKFPDPVKETLAGTAYERSTSISGDLLTLEKSERAVAPEVRYQDALAARARLRTLWRDDVYLRLPDSYKATALDLAAIGNEEPSSTKERLNRGVAYLNAGRYDEAIADLTKVVEAEPKDPWPIANRAMARVWKRQFGEAEKDIAAATALDADNYVLIHARATLATLKGDHRKAADLFEKAIEKNPRNSFALTGRIGSLMNLADYVGATKAIDALQAVDPSNTALPFMRAQIAMSMGDYQGALKTYSSILAAKPDDSNSLFARANAYLAIGEDAKALADSERALKGSNHTEDLRLMRVNIFRRMGEREKSLREAALMTTENPKSDYAYVAAARTYGTFGLHQQAMQAFDKALALKPAAYIYVNRAQTRPITDKAAKRADLEAALKLDPKDADALVAFAALLTDEGKRNEALDYYDRVLAAHPSRKYIQVQRALLLAKLGRVEEAEKVAADYRKDLKAAVEFNNLCWAKATAGLMLQSAVEDCREALRLQPDEAAYHDSLGMAFLRMNRLDESVAAYDKALATRKYPASFMGRALAYAAKGDKTRANADAAAARALNNSVDEEFARYGLKFEDQKALTSK